MQIIADTTDQGGMKLTIIYGPVMVSVILDPSDEDAVIDMIHQAFKEARQRQEEMEHVHTG